MSIRVVCPNGHELKVNESCAGRSGACPKCGAIVQVPRPVEDDLEDAILGVLASDPPPPPPGQRCSGASGLSGSGIHLEPDGRAFPKKVCSKCNREIAAGMHICPHCHTYIAGLRDF